MELYMLPDGSLLRTAEPYDGCIRISEVPQPEVVELIDQTAAVRNTKQQYVFDVE